jgi:hypothetical protein
LSDPGTCRRSGETQVGAPCEKDWDCESGYCRKGTCHRTCLAEEDCSSSARACPRFSDGNGLLACYTEPDGYSDCKVSCPEDRLCNSDKCLPHACHRTAHCPEGDCLLSPDGIDEEELGQCSGEKPLCNEWEFRIEEDDPFCRLPIDCETLDDTVRLSCPEGYECVKGDVDPTGGRDFIGTSWCSRRVTEGEWRPDG